MKIKIETGSDLEKSQAKRVLPIITRHHLLIVTLMLYYATENEALPIFLDVPSWLSIVLSVTLVLIFGEIVPSAIFTGPQQLAMLLFNFSFL
jgi:CBS domain containing-hemolysin-like protein